MKWLRVLGRTELSQIEDAGSHRVVLMLGQEEGAMAALKPQLLQPDGAERTLEQSRRFRAKGEVITSSGGIRALPPQVTGPRHLLETLVNEREHLL